MDRSGLTIGVVGVCGSGKSALVKRLREHGYNARHIAQEHSYAPDMWRRLIAPDILIYLKVSHNLTMARKDFSWSQEEYQEQLERLGHAHQHADLHIDTDERDPDTVLQVALDYLQAAN
jgi:hypothetical protein